MNTRLYSATKKIVLTLSLILGGVCVNAKPLDNFEAYDAPILDFIAWFAGQSLESVIIGTGVKGNITLSINGLDSNDLIPFTRHVLRSQGFELTKRDDYYVIENNRLAVGGASFDEALDSKTHVYSLENIKSTDAIEILNTLVQQEQSASEKSTASHPLKAVALPAGNKIAATGSDRQLRTVSELVKELDVRSGQVFLEAVIVETEVGDFSEIGVNLSTALTNNGFNVISTTMTGLANLSGLGAGGQIVYANDGNLQGLISAIASTDNNKILSTPKILVLDKQAGRISVGQNVPFIVSKEVTDGGNAIQQIERHDVGVSLSVRPSIIGKGRAFLSIRQESSSVTSNTIAADLITNKREISTVAEVESGQTIVLGGLVSEEERKSESGVPILKSIPLLGRLFRYESSQTVQRELTVLIKTLIL